MNSLHDDPWLREKFRALRRYEADTARGFVCILDFRRARGGTESRPTGRFFACAALFALAGFIAGLWVSSRPARPLHLNAAAVQLAAWESPTGFLLAADFQTTQPN